ncbi:MAG: hypothetical protein KGQ45_02535, partial [Burkholderiales bacterium]|nr:hypothetical protein [Burkholderiales bacterium]
IRLLRSPVAPAISAAFLPLALNVTSEWYPVSIAASTGALALLSVAYQRSLGVRLNHTPSAPTDPVDDEMERPPNATCGCRDSSHFWRWHMPYPSSPDSD